ncbi:MAG: hypothetical protein LW854_08765 [Rubrivivax sp.]|jgi:hypothetical protein|nr:hypothetical protein [Rubrivivax sp.]
MIGTQPTGRLPGVVISAVGHEGLSVTANGRPARLAVVDENGQVLVAGPEVAQEAEAVAINMYRKIWQHQGHLRVHSKPLGA